MCVIIHKPKGVFFPEKNIKSANVVNPDGFGYMVYNGKTGRIDTDKSVEMSEERIKKVFASLTNKEACFHFRYKTHGAITNKQCHPFRVLDKEKHGVDMFFMHNGVISSIPKVDILENESDTQAFNRIVLHPLLRDNPGLIKHKSFHRLIQEYIGASKLCFMMGQGEVVLINEEAGDQKDGCWVSNIYSFNSSHRIKTSTYSNSTPGYHKGAEYWRQKNWSQKSCNQRKQNFTFFGVSCEIGDTFTVVSGKDSDFMVEGKVTYIYTDESKFCLEFMDQTNTKNVMTFVTKTGGNSVRDKVPADTYYTFPNVIDEDLALESVEETETDPLTKEFTNVIELDDRRETRKTQQEDKEKEEDFKVLVDSLEEPDEFHVSHANLTVDSKDRYGAGAYVGDEEEYDYKYGSMTVEDFFDASPQERFEYFVDEFQDSFGMLQDLVEYLVLQDKGLNPEDGEVAFEEENTANGI